MFSGCTFLMGLPSFHTCFSALLSHVACRMRYRRDELLVWRWENAYADILFPALLRPSFQHSPPTESYQSSLRFFPILVNSSQFPYHVIGTIQERGGLCSCVLVTELQSCPTFALDFPCQPSWIYLHSFSGSIVLETMS